MAFDLGADRRLSRLVSGGSLALIGVGITYTICLWLTVAGAPGIGSTAQAYLQSVSGHVGLNAALWVTYMVGDLLLIPALAALYLVFAPRKRPLVTVGLGIVAVYIAFDLGVTEPNWLALTSLANGFATASAAQQAYYISAAQYALALVPILNAMSFIVSCTGFLIVIAAMFGGPLRRATVWFGAAVMVIGLLAGVSFFVPSLGIFVAACLGGFAVWCILVGAQLYRYSERAALEATAQSTEGKMPSVAAH